MRNGRNMKILDAEEIEKDIRMGEDQIGWNYDYKIVSIDMD